MAPHIKYQSLLLILSLSASLYAQNISRSITLKGAYTVEVSSQISGTIYQDDNANGVKDNGESGLSGRRIDLYGPQDTTLFSDVNGNFSISGLPFGAYLLAQEIPSGWVQTQPSASSITYWWERQESEVARFKHFFRLVSNAYQYRIAQIPPTYLGYTIPDSLKSNGYGNFSATSVSTNQVSFTSSAYGGSSTLTADCDTNGSLKDYSTAGTYSTSRCAVDATTPSVSGINLGSVAFTIRGSKFLNTRDSTYGLAGWRINLNGSIDTFAITDANGNYMFQGMPWGVYTVSEDSQAGWRETLPAPEPELDTLADPMRNIWLRVEAICDSALEYRVRPVTLGGGGGSFYGFSIPTTMQSDTVALYSLQSQGQWNMNLVAASLKFGFNTLTIVCDTIGPRADFVQEAGGWQGEVGKVPPAKYFLPLGRYQVERSLYGSRTSIGNIKFGNSHPGDVAGVVFRDQNANQSRDVGESGLAGWHVHAAGPVIDSTTTDGSGSFTLGSLPPASYVLTVGNQAGWNQTSPQVSFFNSNRDSVIDNFNHLIKHIYELVKDWSRYRIAPLSIDGPANSSTFISYVIPLALNYDTYGGYDNFTSYTTDSVVFEAFSNTYNASITATFDSLSHLKRLTSTGDFSGLGYQIINLDSAKHLVASANFGIKQPIAAPIISQTTPASPANNNSPAIIGTAQPGSTVKIYSGSCNGTLKGTGTADGNGTFSIIVSVADNTTTMFFATATDILGTSPCSSTGITYVEDSQTPTVPFALSTIPQSPANNIHPIIKGQTSPNAVIRIRRFVCGGPLFVTGTADLTGAFSIQVSVTANSTTRFYLTASDSANNTSACSAPLIYTDDTSLVACSSLTLNPLKLAYANVGIPFNQTISAIGGGGKYTYTTTTPPPGLTLTSSGMLSGIPSTVGTFLFNVHCVDSTGCSGDKSYTLNVYPLGSLIGTVFRDMDKNGLKDAGDVGLPGWKVKMYGNADDSAMTDGNGNYSFANKAIGTYLVFQELRNGWQESYPNSIGHAIDSLQREHYIGMFKHMLMIASDAFEYRNKLSALGGGNGSYVGYAIPLNLRTDDNANYSTDTSIATRIYFSASPVFGVGLNVYCDSSGFLRSTVPSQLVTIDNVVQNYSAINFGDIPYEVKGKVFANERDTTYGLTGWRVHLHGSMDTSTISDPNGNYVFSPITDGFYIVSEEIQTSWGQNLPPTLGSAYDSVDNNGLSILEHFDDIIENAWAYRLTPTSKGGGNGSYSGYIVPPGLASDTAGFYQTTSTATTLNIIGASSKGYGTISAVLDSTGRLFSFTYSGQFIGEFASPSGKYLLRVKIYQLYDVNDIYATGNINFGNSHLASLQGTVYRDANENGLHDGGEPGLANRKIYIGGPIVDSVYSNQNGDFIASNLPSGTYVLSEAYQANWGETSPMIQAFSSDRDLVIRNLDEMIYHLHVIASRAYGYRTLLTTYGGGGGTYLGFFLGSLLASTDFGTFSITPSSSVITINATSLSGYGTVQTVIDSLGRLNNLTFTGRFASSGFRLIDTDSSHSIFTNLDFGNKQFPSTPVQLHVTPNVPSNDNHPTISGVSDAGAMIKVYMNQCSGSPVATGLTDSAGFFAISVTVADNSSTTFYATSSNIFGESSCTPSGVTYVEDSQPPAIPSGLTIFPTPPANYNNPVLSGITEPYATLQAFANTCSGVPVWTSVADSNGKFSITLSVADNSTTTFYVKAQDQAGNISTCSGGISYIEDSQAPQVPFGLSIVPQSPANNNSPVITGSSAPFAFIRIYRDSCSGTPLVSGSANGSGVFSIQVSVADNTTTIFHASARDSAGNVSSCSLGISYTEDSQPPMIPGNLSINVGLRANNNSPILSGTAEPLSVVSAYGGSCSGTPLSSVTANSSGTFSIQLTVGDNTITTFFAKATDQAGNTSGCSTGITYIEDSQAPTPPTNLSAILSGTSVSVNWSASSANDLLRYRIYGSTSPAPLIVLDSTNSGNTSKLIGGLLTEMNYYFRITAIDSAFNESAFSSEVQTTTGCDIVVRNGWNLLSVPVASTHTAKDSLFPNASSSAFIFSNRYEIVDTIPHSKGFWIKFGSKHHVVLTGVPIFLDTIDVDAGWNLIGSVFSTTSVTNISSIPPHLITSEFFVYDSNGTYKVATKIDSGQGSWVKVSTSGKLILGPSSLSSISGSIRIMHSEEQPPKAPAQTSGERSADVPKSFALYQNFPNPFNPRTSIAFDLPKQVSISIKLFDLLGQTVLTLLENKSFPAGHYEVSVDANALSSGIYFYQLQSRDFVHTKKLVLLK